MVYESTKCLFDNILLAYVCPYILVHYFIVSYYDILVFIQKKILINGLKYTLSLLSSSTELKHFTIHIVNFHIKLQLICQYVNPCQYVIYIALDYKYGYPNVAVHIWKINEIFIWIDILSFQIWSTFSSFLLNIYFYKLYLIMIKLNAVLKIFLEDFGFWSFGYQVTSGSYFPSCKSQNLEFWFKN